MIIIVITKPIIKIKIKLIKSWRKINSSIIGELASWRPNWPHVIIYKNIEPNKENRRIVTKYKYSKYFFCFIFNIFISLGTPKRQK